MDTRPPDRRSACPINACLEMFGDRWTLLIVRDLLFSGRTAYSEFLAAEEGMATTILADRLRRMEENGIVRRRRDGADGRRVSYALTEKGLDLAPILIEMVLWAARYEQTAAPPALVRRMRADRPGFVRELRRQHEAAERRKAPAGE